jgi:hypothetical protein
MKHLAIETMFQGLLDDQQIVEANDNRYSMRSISLWTKADSITCVDDVSVMVL